MKALVLGGSGFVGRRLVEALLGGGNDVTVLNRGVTRAELSPAVRRLVADRSDFGAVEAAIGRSVWDAVFDVSGVVKVAGGTDVADLAALFDGRAGRYVYVSSQSLYRMTGEFPWREDSPILAPDPTTYGGFKAAAEHALLARHRATGFPVAIARPGAIYGPHNNIYDMEAAMFRRLLEERPVLLPHGGLVVCSYGHVDDLCRALLAMATLPDAVGEVFNVTTSAHTSAAYVATLAAVVGVTPDVVDVPAGTTGAGGPADGGSPLYSRLFGPAHHAALDAAKIRRVLGVTPEYTLASGHADTFDWYLRSGAAAADRAASDPLWNRTFDLQAEARVALRLRAAAVPQGAR